MYSNELISPLLHSGHITLEILLDRKDGLPESSKIAVFRLFSTIPFLIGGLPIFSVPLLSHTRFNLCMIGTGRACAAPSDQFFYIRKGCWSDHPVSILTIITQFVGGN